MSTTLVGVFDDREEALQARNRLREMGVDDASIRLDSGGDVSTATPTTASSEPVSEKRGSIRGFFAELFGTGVHDDEARRDEPGTYAEAVRRGSTVLTVRVDDDTQADRIEDALVECGAIDVDQRVEQWAAGGYSRHDEAAAPMTHEQIADERNRMKVVEEEVRVGKRQVERGGVRVRRFVSERPIEQQVTLREERAVVDREPVDRPATEADLQQAFKEETIELRETAEEPVVEKRARVVEEVRVGTEASERTETVRDTVRRSDVEVEPVSGNGTGAVASNAERYSGPERRIGTSGGWTGEERRRSAAR